MPKIAQGEEAFFQEEAWQEQSTFECRSFSSRFCAVKGL